VIEDSSRPNLFAQIVEDWKAHGRDWTRPGFQAVAVHRFGNWRMGIRQRPIRLPLSFLYRVLFTGVRNFYGIELPYTARVGRRVVFEHQGGIVIHGFASLGDDCVVRQGVTLGNRTFEERFTAPQLGNRVNVGAGAKVLGRVSVGDDAQIGANAVVLEDVPVGGVAVGIPARLVTKKAPEKIASVKSASTNGGSVTRTIVGPD
jgi:serine O-acetyltransferase